MTLYTATNNKRYLVVSAFQELRNPADCTVPPQYKYELLIYQWPEKLKQLNSFSNSPYIVEHLNPDEVVTCLKSVELALPKSASQPDEKPQTKQFIAVALIKLDKAVELALYQSYISLYEIDLSAKRLKLSVSESYTRIITCVSQYRGYLVAAAQAIAQFKDIDINFFSLGSGKLLP